MALQERTLVSLLGGTVTVALQYDDVQLMLTGVVVTAPGPVHVAVSDTVSGRSAAVTLGPGLTAVPPGLSMARAANWVQDGDSDGLGSRLSLSVRYPP